MNDICTNMVRICTILKKISSWWWPSTGETWFSLLRIIRQICRAKCSLTWRLRQARWVQILKHQRFGNPGLGLRILDTRIGFLHPLIVVISSINLSTMLATTKHPCSWSSFRNITVAWSQICYVLLMPIVPPMLVDKRVPNSYITN